MCPWYGVADSFPPSQERTHTVTHHHVTPDTPEYADSDNGRAFAEFTQCLQDWLATLAPCNSPELLLTGDAEIIIGLSYNGCPIGLTANITP